MEHKQIDILASKLTANQQRRFREEYLERLTPELGTYLKSQRFITQPELGEVFQKWKAVTDKKAESSTQHFESSFPWEGVALEIVHNLPSQHDSESGLMLIDIKDGAFEAQFGWARKNFNQLFQATRTRSLALFRADFRAGIVVDSYAGEYANNPNPDGVVYETEQWGFMRHIDSGSS